MAEQQLVDYIKKAKESGQADDQTRNLLIKNGWTEAEVNDAFLAINQLQAKPQSQVQPQAVSQPKFQQSNPSVQPNQPVSQQQTKPQPQVQPQAFSQPKTAMPGTTIRKPSSHVVLKLLSVLVVIVLLGGGAYFVAGQYFNFPWNPFAITSEKVIEKMVTNMKNVKSSHSVVLGQIDVANTGVSQGKVVFSLNSDTDIIDATNAKANSTISVNVTPTGTTAPIGAATINMMVSGGAAYIKIDDLVIPEMETISGLNVEQIKGTWFKIDQDSTRLLQEASGQSASYANFSELQNANLGNKINELFLAQNIFTVKQKLADEVIGEQNTYHYLIAISSEKLKEILSSIIDLQMQEAVKAQGADAAGTNSLAINMAKNFVNSFVDTIGEINMEIWIGKKDYMLYRVKMDKLIDTNSIVPDTNAQVTLSFSVENSNFNQPVVVQTPEVSQKIEDTLLPIIKLGQINNYLVKISGIAESIVFASKSYSSLCYKGLLNGYEKTYGQELTGVASEIVKQGAKNPICFGNASNYCASTQLADGTWLCIGKGGIQGTVKCLSALTACQ